MVGKVITITAWLSFLASVWLWLFEILPWQAPVIMLLLVIVVFGFHEAVNRK